VKAAEILGVDAVTFIEPAFAALPDAGFNTLLAETPAEEGRLLVDEHEEPVALAFRGTDGWTAGSFLCRNPSLSLIEQFENLSGEIFQEDRAIWAAAVREYYSTALLAAVPPSMEDLNPKRRGILTDLIREFWGTGNGGTCIDACCGSGVGSLVLRDLGYAPLSYDNDETLLCRGLTEKRLLPEETMWLDATIASQYIQPVPKGIGIMMGEINSFSQDMWQRIVSELFALSQETIITVGTEPEAPAHPELGRGTGQGSRGLRKPGRPDL
jgi:hypothetical protein